MESAGRGMWPQEEPRTSGATAYQKIAKRASEKTTDAAATAENNIPGAPPEPEERKFFRKMDLLLRKLHGLPDVVNEETVESPFEKLVSPSESREVMKRETELLVQRLVKCLEAVSSSIEPQTAPPPKSIVGDFVMKRTYTAAPLPEMPAQWNSPGELVRYLDRLSRKIHVNAQYSGPTGLVGQIIKDLLRPNNEATRRILSVDAFNWGIRYFVRHGDVRSARTLYYDMLSTGLVPSTLTYNMLLYPLRKVFRNPNAVWRQHPVLVACHYLRQMAAHGVSADAETWNLALVMLPHKAELLATMRAKGIGLDSRSVAACLEDVCAIAGPRAATGYLRSQLAGDGVVGDDAVHTVLRHFLQRGQMGEAWRVLAEFAESGGMRPKKRTLNVFCAEAARLFRVDWILAAMGTFQRRWGVDADSHTYAHLLEAAVRLPASARKWDTLAMAAGFAARKPNSSHERWLRKARDQLALAQRLGRSSVQLGVPLTPQQKALAARATAVDFSDRLAGDLTEVPDALAAAHDLGIPAELFAGEAEGRPVLESRRVAAESSPAHQKQLAFYASRQKARHQDRVASSLSDKQRIVSAGPLEVFADKLRRAGVVK